MKIGLVLGGGGSKGSYQLGVLKSLYEYNMLDNLKVVSGASIGAINSSLVVSGASIEEMQSFWSHISNDNVYKANNERRKSLFDQTVMYNTLIEFQSKDLFRNSNIKTYASISRAISSSIIDQLNKNTMVNELIFLNEHEEPHKVILASSSIPVVFGPTIIDNKYYLDGGLTNNLPVEIMLEEDCDVIIVIGLNPGYELDKYNSNNLIINYSPTNNLTKSFLGTLNFDDNEEFFDLGYENANMINEYLHKNKLLNNKTNGLIEIKVEEEIKKVSHR